MLKMSIFQLTMFIFGVVFISTPALTCLWNLQVFDSNNDQRISREEFKSGLKKLSFLVMLKIPSWKNAHTVTYLDFNGPFIMNDLMCFFLGTIFMYTHNFLFVGVIWWFAKIAHQQVLFFKAWIFHAWKGDQLRVVGDDWLKLIGNVKLPSHNFGPFISCLCVFFGGSHQRPKNPRLFFDNPEISMVKMLQWSSSTYWIKIPLVRLHWKRSISFQTGLSGMQRMETAGKGRIQEVP